MVLFPFRDMLHVHMSNRIYHACGWVESHKPKKFLSWVCIHFKLNRLMMTNRLPVMEINVLLTPYQHFYSCIISKIINTHKYSNLNHTSSVSQSQNAGVNSGCPGVAGRCHLCTDTWIKSHYINKIVVHKDYKKNHRRAKRIKHFIWGSTINHLGGVVRIFTIGFIFFDFLRSFFFPEMLLGARNLSKKVWP